MSQEAFIGVLACARAADGAYPEEERNLINLICQTHALTRDISPDRYLKIAQETRSHIGEVGWQAAMNKYLEELPSDWAYTALLSVIDICLIDSKEHSEEHRCVDMVAKYFSLPADHVENFMQWFRVKNGHVLRTVEQGPENESQVA